MATPQITHQPAPDVDAVVGDDESQLRELALEQLQRRQKFRGHAVGYAATCVVLIIIWAVTEYHNAGGWPTSGFSQSSSIPHKWNSWIIYPVLGLGVFLGIDAWNTFGRRPITEADVQREIERLRAGR